MDLFKQNILVAGYGLPAEMAISTLFSLGVLPEQISVLTHENDSRNSGLHALCDLRNIRKNTESAKSVDTLEWVKIQRPDIILSIHYRNIIPKALLDLASLGGVNLHPSLLPKYKGAHSVSWSLINEDEFTGFTYHYMDETLDTGNILFQESIKIEDSDTSFSLFHKQILQALQKLPLVLQMVLGGDKGYAQEGEGSYFNRDLPYDGKINREWSESKIDRFIRAMFFPPFAPAKLDLDGEEYYFRTITEYKSKTKTL
ncbi:formyltransferase family protein [Pseudoalteromonas sp. MMG024]|uniref:formyltransferase family protein n=1 Tax=Pseudoalteromonas sp. MMG024 TaxID=2909980 RepID=UPI001F163C3F|nr:formyltransferase family protein [Pseudoalteromonas sp. MMG024]MCF6457546.1 methionyl-tRNA formyltransferase [Pseudoalteromonas sp. MMG024]